MVKSTGSDKKDQSSQPHSLSVGILEAIVEMFPDIIHSVDHEGRLVSVNRKAAELLGYQRDELLGMSVFDIYADEVATEVRKGFKKLQNTGFIDRIESKLKARDGTVIDVEIRSLSLYDATGKFIKSFSIIRDIRTLNNMKQQLIQQSKLAAIGELASSIMHDIRNPLAIIDSANEHLMAKAIEKKDWALVEKCQANIRRAAKKISRLSEHLRDFSRLDEEKMAHISLSAMIDDCIFMVQTRLNESGSVLKNLISDSELSIYGRENQLEQVIINLMSNASDAMKDNDGREKTLTLSLEESDGFDIIVVTDTGSGISEDKIGRIFESFFTTKPKGVGTGLGLSICKAIIDDHKGSISVDSIPDQGTIFRVALPKNSKS